ncbi:MAG: 50S ribosomal protein L6 [Opitutaceae bacterium]|nr:50S ribosomal protein L6 [Opitutaceae bacterium]
MSRIGKKPIPVAGAKVSVSGNLVTVEAGSNRLSINHRPEVSVKVDGDQVFVERIVESRISKAMHGLTRSLIANMIQGVTKGYEKNLEINGVGWTAKLQGNKVNLKVGYADTRVVEVPTGIKVDIQQNKLKISGADKQLVGQIAAEIRAHRKPEPYNGRGIKYSDEHIIRKQGKAFASG